MMNTYSSALSYAVSRPCSRVRNLLPKRYLKYHIRLSLKEIREFLGQESRFFHVFFAYLHSLIPDDYYHGKRLFPDY